MLEKYKKIYLKKITPEGVFFLFFSLNLTGLVLLDQILKTCIELTETAVIF